MSSGVLDEKAVAKLRALSNESKLAAAIFRVLANRERPRDTIDLRRLKGELSSEGLSITTKEFMDVFLKLQKQGFGVVQNPRSANDAHRFKMADYNPIALGRAAIGKAVEAFDEEDTRGPSSNDALLEIHAEMVRHIVKSGGTGTAIFHWCGTTHKLPVNDKLTEAEIDGLISILQTMKRQL